MLSFTAQIIALVLLIVFSYFGYFRYSRRIKILFGLTFVGLTLISGYNIFLQYKVWEDSDLGQFLLPPYQPSYAVFYMIRRFLVPLMAPMLIALGFIATLYFGNKKFDKRFFEDGEEYIFASSIIVMGYPTLVFYLPVLGFIYLVWHVVTYIQSKKEARLPLYNLWAIAGLATVLLSEYWLSHTPIWLLLKV